jgi:hypothetical protein
MTGYLLGDTPISSTTSLCLLPKSADELVPPALAVSRARRPVRPRAVREWRHQWRDESGRVVMGLARNRAGYLLRFPRTCDFHISQDAGRIGVCPHRPAEAGTLEHLLADQVLPRCLGHQGQLVVHAAGVAFGQDIAVFVGESGRGKSTLAGMYLRAGRTVLSDDCLVLRPTTAAVWAVPTYPSLRLRKDTVDALFPDGQPGAVLSSYSDKRRFVVPQAAPHASDRGVAAIYFLGDAGAAGPKATIEPLAPATACIRLMEQSFQLDVLARDSVARLLKAASEVVARVPSFTLTYPRDFGRVEELTTHIERHLAGIAGPAHQP